MPVDMSGVSQSGTASGGIATSPAKREFGALNEAIDAALKEGSDLIDALNRLEAWVRDDHVLLLEATDAHLRDLLRLLISAKCRTERSAIRSHAMTAEAVQRAHSAADNRIASKIERGWLDWVLPHTMVPMRSATQKELWASAKAGKAQAKTITEDAKFCDLVAKALPKGKKVGQHFDEKSLIHMRRRAHA